MFNTLAEELYKCVLTLHSSFKIIVRLIVARWIRYNCISSFCHIDSIVDQNLASGMAHQAFSIYCHNWCLFSSLMWTIPALTSFHIFFCGIKIRWLCRLIYKRNILVPKLLVCGPGRFRWFKCICYHILRTANQMWYFFTNFTLIS